MKPLPLGVRRVVITGSECTGKTTLAEALADALSVEWVPEFARIWVERAGRPPAYDDVEEIARGQIELENEVIAGAAARRDSAESARRHVIQDTDLLSTLIYSHHYYGDCPDWIEEAFAERRADLYLLAGIDVPWVPDGDLRDRGDRREEMHELFRGTLLQRGLPVAELCGPHEERLAAAVAALTGNGVGTHQTPTTAGWQ